MLARTTKHTPADGSTHWSSRKLAAELGGGISHMTVARIWAKHNLKPHRLEGYLASNDPDFETEAAGVIGLYLNPPPQHAAVFCVDEKTAIQALDRKDPVLLLSPGRAERHGFEYFRHGTLSLYAAAHVLDEVTGGQNTVGLRCPAHPVALAVLRCFGGGLAAPSADRFGRISPTTAQHVRDEFGAAVPIVLNGGDCAVGIESTIVDPSGSKPRILRPGMISQARIEAVIGAVEVGVGRDSPRASGTLDAHYAPRTPLLLLPRMALERETGEQRAFSKRIAVLALQQLPADCEGIVLPNHPDAYAHGLYAALHGLDARGDNLLLVEGPPETSDWLAVHDRLRRSAAGAGDDDAP